MNENEIESFDENDKEDDELIEQAAINTDTESSSEELKDRKNIRLQSRTKEEFDSMVQEEKYETFYNTETGEPYKVKVSVMKPQPNPYKFNKET